MKTAEGFKQQFNTIISKSLDKKYPKQPKSTNKVGGKFGHIGCNKPYLEPTEIINLNNNVCLYCGGIHFEDKISKLKRKGYLIYLKRNPTKQKKKRENYGIL